MVTVVPFNGNDRFLIEETEFPLRKQTEACHEGRRVRCLFPDKAVGIAVETVLVRSSQRAEYGTYQFLFGGREQPVSLARGVIVLSSHLSYHPFAESSRLLHRQLTCFYKRTAFEFVAQMLSFYKKCFYGFMLLGKLILFL